MREGLLLGLDLGGTHVKYGLGDHQGQLLREGSLPTRASEGRPAVLESLAAAAQLARDEASERGARLLAIGLGSPGVIDPRTGRALYPTSNLPDWAGVDLAGFLGDRFGVPVVVDNDANAALYGEVRYGAARGARHACMATVGTGIGGGALVDGRILRGAWGGGMELGHIPFEEQGRPCGCGKRGCLEAYAGSRGLIENWSEARAAAGAAVDSAPPAAAGAPTVRDLLAAAARGEPAAQSALQRGASSLAVGLVTALYLLNSEVLLVGGGVVDGHPPFFGWIEEEVRLRALPKVVERLRISRAEHGNRAGVLGALALAADHAEI